MGFFTNIANVVLPSKAVVDERKNEIAMVHVKDIKQYLVEEYERSKQLYEKYEELQEELEKTEEIKIKYDATLVTLSEYEARLKRLEETIKKREEAINIAKAESKELRNELNDYKIRFSRAALDKEDIKKEVVEETKQEIIKAIKAQKGNLSKILVTGIIQNVQVYKPKEEIVNGETSR